MNNYYIMFKPEMLKRYGVMLTIDNKFKVMRRYKDRCVIDAMLIRKDQRWLIIKGTSDWAYYWFQPYQFARKNRCDLEDML